MPPDLGASPIGKTIPISGHDPRFDEDYAVDAFLPDPLPHSVDLPSATWMLITQAASELGRLDAAAALVPNPSLIARIATRQEAVGTSALEGTYANLADVFAAEVVPEEDRSSDALPPNVREVVNYARAADLAYQWIEERPITMAMLSALQQVIIRGTESDGPTAGRIRTSQVFIGAKKRRVSEARFVPPPPGDQLIGGCEQWVEWLTRPDVRDTISLIPRIAMAHYQFETLHPYTDGNGRIGRLVVVLQMLSEGTLRSPVLSVSTWLKERGDEYRDHLRDVSATGDWEPWIAFFATAVREEAGAAHNRIMKLLELREEVGERVREAMPRARLAVEIAEDLIAFPMLTVAQAQRRFGRTNQANRNAINQLVDLGVLQHYDDQRYDRMFWNPRVFQIMDG